MQDAEFIANIAGNAQDHAIPRFFIKAVKNNFKSNAEGMSVYDQKEYVEILIPGDRNSIPIRPVNEKDKARWPKHYLAFKNNQVLAEDGFPLEQWPLIDLGQIEHLKQFNCRTVEHLSKLNDTHIQKMGMGVRALRDKAIVYLEQARDNSGVSRVVAENESLKLQLATQAEQIAAMVSRLDAMAAKEAERPAGGFVMPAPAAPQPDLAALVAQAVAAAMAAQTPAEAPKNRGGRPRKPQPDDHSEQPPTE
jgi:hypothetical protein